VIRIVASLGFVGVLVFTLAGCSEPPPPTPTVRDDPEPPPPSPWRDDKIAVPDGEALQQAIDEARTTAAEARRRWTGGDLDARSRWAIKWAAETIDGGVEHVWIMPVTSWTEHRIEGVLASEPHRPLLSGRVVGDPVSLPADDLSDWAHFIDGDRAGPREGGFTIDALSEQFGEPGSS
jgi:uncharacterized protein YegJ (DUF2314 family)